MTFHMIDEDLEGYDKMVSGRRKAGRVSHISLHTSSRLIFVFHMLRVSPLAIFVSVFLF